MSNVDYLTKSRYVAGLQCLRRLWLNVHEPPDWEEPELGSAQDVALEIGLMARLLFPGGVLVEDKPWEHAAAMARTVSLMSDRSVPAIFEAACSILGQLVARHPGFQARGAPGIVRVSPTHAG